MVLLGLGIFIASVSFLCYRHPPSSWPFLRWLRPQQHHLDGGAKTWSQALIPTINLDDPHLTKPKLDSKAVLPAPSVVEEEVVKKEDLDRRAMPPPPAVAKEVIDRKAMPPPPPPSKKAVPASPSTPITPRASVSSRSSTVSVSSSSPEDDQQEDEPYVPSFPAANSAQRASSGTGAPPRLNALPRSNTQTSTSLMPPPARPNPLPNRGPPSSISSSLTPPPTHNSIPVKPRKKVLLTPGHSPLDWAHLSSNPSISLTAFPSGTPYLRVPPSLLKTMTGRKGKNAWTVLGGKVYNITPYLPYHPGGEAELLRCAGKDGTRLFGEVHPWVNWEGMLSECLVGVAVDESEVKHQSTLDEMD